MCAPVYHQEQQTAATNSVRIEIQSDKLLTLLRQGLICAADLRCLDCNSKRCLLRLVMKACAANLTEESRVPNQNRANINSGWIPAMIDRLKA